MIIPIELRFKVDKDSKSAFRTDKKIKSHDVNSVEFHISLDGLELTDNHTAKILSIFHSSKSQVNVTNLLYIDPSINMTQSSHYVGRSWGNIYSGQDGIAMDRSHIRVRDGRFSYDINLFRTWLSEQHAVGNPLTVQYHIESTVELLSQELQDKLNNLRSFENSNYVYAVINDKTDILPTVAENLKPTLHTTFKSKGWYYYYLKIKGA